ncbi:DUF374 domain-containing protein [bacterium]|nr:DUF374 domain-containing protein [bacterium]
MLIPPGRRLWRIVLWAMEHVVARMVRLYARTWRVQYIGLENLRAASRQGARYFCSWHGLLYATGSPYVDRGIYGMISPAWEGDLIAAVLKGVGYKTVRGSSGMQRPEEFRRAVTILREGHPFAHAMDGPEGPARQIKPGIITMAAAGRAAMILSGAAASPAFRLPTWERHLIPLPFARVVVGHAAPLFWSKRPRGEALREAVAQAEAAMVELEGRCEAHLREWKGGR